MFKLCDRVIYQGMPTIIAIVYRDGSIAIPASEDKAREWLLNGNHIKTLGLTSLYIETCLGHEMTYIPKSDLHRVKRVRLIRRRECLN